MPYEVKMMFVQTVKCKTKKEAQELADDFKMDPASVFNLTSAKKTATIAKKDPSKITRRY